MKQLSTKATSEFSPEMSRIASTGGAVSDFCIRVVWLFQKWTFKIIVGNDNFNIYNICSETKHKLLSINGNWYLI